ncbi:hypothetical protein, partial [Xanthomonas bonasiae]|uniref:hypothetical protein n=1 Tax=Xanthomonas bonasiae TaxID=2810351 RepID=UPI001981427F
MHQQLWRRQKSCAINASHERQPQLLFLVLRFSDAAGGGRSAFTLKETSAASPKAASDPGGFFHAAGP